MNAPDPIPLPPERQDARSPWAAASDFEQAAIEPLEGPVQGQVVVPGSKSFSNRALLLAAAARGQSRLEGLLLSDDSYWCTQAIQQLGAKVELDGTTVMVEGTGGRWRGSGEVVFAGSSGTASRFLTALLAAGCGHWLLDGSSQLRQRPLGTLVNCLRAQGALIRYRQDDGCLPLDIASQGLLGGEVRVSGEQSSQYLSGLLMAAPLARAATMIEVTGQLVQPDYVRITTAIMRRFGAKLDRKSRFFRVQPGGYTGADLALEADASSACYFWALAALTGGCVRVNNLPSGSLQPDRHFTTILERLGCRITDHGAGGLEVQGPTQLRGNQVFDLKPMSDQALTVAALAPFADGPVTVTGVEHIRQHETDRIDAICRALKQLGGKVEERRDGFRIWPGPLEAAVLDPQDDHRLTMTFSLLATQVPGLRILDPGSVSKTCPPFFELLAELGVTVQLR